MVGHGKNHYFALLGYCSTFISMHIIKFGKNLVLEVGLVVEGTIGLMNRDFQIRFQVLIIWANIQRSMFS